MSNDKIRARRTYTGKNMPEDDTEIQDMEAKINASMDHILSEEEEEDESPLWNFSEEEPAFDEEAGYDADSDTDGEDGRYRDFSDNEEDSDTEDEEDGYRDPSDYVGEDSDYGDEDGEYEDSEEDYGEEASEEEDYDEDTPEEEDYDEDTPEEEGYDEDDAEEEKPRPAVKNRAKSARPRPIVYVPTDDMDQKIQIPDQPRRKKKKHKGLKIFGLLLLMILVAGGCAYAGVTYYFSDRFFEGTWINGVNCSQMTAYEAENALAQKVETYSIQVSSRNFEPETISGDQIGYSYLSSGEVLALLKQQKPYEWIKGMYEQKNYTVAENIAYDRNLLQQQVKSLQCAQAENQVEPENAYVAYQNDQFVIVPETEGSKLNIKQAYQILDEAVANSERSVDFNSSEDAYVKAEVTQDSAELQSALEACNNYTNASITYTFGDQSVTLDGTTIKDWLQFDEKGQLVWDDNSFQQHITDYVAQLAATYNTVGTEREFHTTSGRVVYVYGANYGWQIDQASEVAELTQEIQTGTQTTREPVYSQTANSHGVNDLGDTYIEVDLSNQHMYYYQSGSIIFESDFVSGNMSYADRQTHAGIYTLYYKKSPDVLRGSKKADGTYEYEQEVTYWMPFDGGIGFHDASWRDSFGGDIYLTSGSHGCINLPTDSAATLYSIIDYNVPIVCFY